MVELLGWLEDSALGAAVRGAGVWSYGLLNLGHILGIAVLFGAVVVLDLRLLGLWRRVPLAHLVQPTVPLAAAGFAVAVATGLCMLSTNAGEYVGNPFLLIKFIALPVALANALVVSRLAAWRAIGVRDVAPHEERHLAVGGAVSLLAWLAVVAAGRMIGYW